MEKKCPTCGNMIKAQIKQNYVKGIWEEQVIFECPCGYYGVGRPRK